MAGGRCFSCGYDLTGVRADTCPECGRRAFDERDVLDHSAVRWRRSRWIAAAVVVGVFSLFLLICAGLLP